jgi:hypothetical protein
MKITDPKTFDGFRYREFVWQEIERIPPEPSPLKFHEMSKEDQRLEYFYITKIKSSEDGRTAIIPMAPIHERVDIDIEFSPDDNEEQNIIITLKANSFTYAKEDYIIKRQFFLENLFTLERQKLLKYLRQNIIKDALSYGGQC